MATWTLNDETKANSYGFRVLNKDLDLERFKQNPVMLTMHRDWDPAAVIGRWTNVRVDGHLVLAEDDFDMEDPEAAKIAGKVKRGFLKACSMGLLFMKENLQVAADGVLELVKSELVEASIVNIPSNSNAVRLYAGTGELLKEEEVRLALSAIEAPGGLASPRNDETTKPTNDKMEKFTLSGPALAILLAAGLSNQEDPAAVNATIAKLGADLKQAQDDLSVTKDALKNMKDAQLAQLKAQADALVNAAVVAGKITADKKEQFVKLALSDFTLASTVLDSMPGKTNLSGSIIGNPHGGAADPKNLDEFEKLPTEKQLAFKAENPEGYMALFS